MTLLLENDLEIFIINIHIFIVLYYSFHLGMYYTFYLFFHAFLKCHLVYKVTVYIIQFESCFEERK